MLSYSSNKALSSTSQEGGEEKLGKKLGNSDSDSDSNPVNSRPSEVKPKSSLRRGSEYLDLRDSWPVDPTNGGDAENNSNFEGESVFDEELELRQYEVRQAWCLNASSCSSVSCSSTGQANDSMKKNGLGLAVGVGATRPWVFYGVLGSMLVDFESQWEISIGQGNQKFLTKRSSLYFEVQNKTRAIDVNHHWFLLEGLPLSANLGMGYASWLGSLNPSGNNLEESQRFQTGYAGSGIYFFGGLGLSYFSLEGFYFRFTLAGIGASKVVELSLTRDVAEAQLMIQSTLEQPQTFGFVNVSTGWFF